MKAFQSPDEILDFAMQSEQEAVEFYTALANRMKNPQMREVFLEFAKEEVGHKARLQRMKEEKFFTMESHQINDLKIADYVVSTSGSSELDYADALILAMKKEKAAYKLYHTLAERALNAELKKIFQALAMEESKHKLRFEIEYDEYVMREN